MSLIKDYNVVYNSQDVNSNAIAAEGSFLKLRYIGDDVRISSTQSKTHFNYIAEITFDDGAKIMLRTGDVIKRPFKRFTVTNIYDVQGFQPSPYGVQLSFIAGDGDFISDPEQKRLITNYYRVESITLPANGSSAHSSGLTASDAQEITIYNDDPAATGVVYASFLGYDIAPWSSSIRIPTDKPLTLQYSGNIYFTSSTAAITKLKLLIKCRRDF